MILTNSTPAHTEESGDSDDQRDRLASHALLEVRGLKSRYGPIEALHGIDIRINEGEVVSIVGSNGAGKTTLLKVLSGVQERSAGSITYRGANLAGMSPSARVRAGICHVPEGRQIFNPMTIEDNLKLGGFTRPRAELDGKLEEVYELFPVLKEKRALPAGTLSGGQQQMLAIGRALMGKPQLLLLDEPSMGLAPLIVREIFSVVRKLQATGLSILLVEQNARAALAMADWGYVLASGNVAVDGPGGSLLENQEVGRAYLGM
jgi:branched-chain amino acid transport system ATP-binding protein